MSVSVDDNLLGIGGGELLRSRTAELMPMTHVYVRFRSPEPRSPARARIIDVISVAVHRLNRRNHPKLGEYVAPAHIACMKNQAHPLEGRRAPSSSAIRACRRSVR